MTAGKIIWTPDEDQNSGAETNQPQETGEATASPASSPSLNEELEEARNQIQELENKLKYLEADFTNFRRRKVKDLEDVRTNTGCDMISHFMPVMDAIEAALKFKDGDAAKVAEGVTLIHHQLRSTLKNQGVEVIDPAPGDVAEPELHQGLATEPYEEGKLPGTIVSVMGIGYKLGTRVIRPARVVVVEEAPAQESDADPQPFSEGLLETPDELGKPTET